MAPVHRFPVHHLRPAFIASVLVASALLAGCLDSDAPTDVDATHGSSPGADGNMTGNETVDPALDIANRTFVKPDWQVGQWWGHHMFFGANDTTGTHTNVYVVEDAGDSWITATENEPQARRDAQEDLFNLGTFGKEDLTGTFEGQAWKWYQWPLSATSSWHQPMVINGAVYHTDFRASVAPEIATANGLLPGLVIKGTTAQGALVAQWDYVPQLGWFANAEIYDANNDPDNPYLRVINMGFGDEKPGQGWVIFDSEELISHTYKMSGSAPEGESLVKLTVPEDASAISGKVDIVVASGLARVILEDPDGTQYKFPGGDLPATSSQSFDVLLEDVVPGEWRMSVVGAGQTTEVQIDLIAETPRSGTL